MSLRNALFAAFALSGFSGLIYESIWTHYLKLFLGHAAYAQTLVLGIFMGGMAIGAWVAALRSQRWQNALRAYALCEGLLGLMALGFHPAFTAFLDFAYDRAIPSLDSPDAVIAFKWIAAAALILPQSILLGMTFPLMSTGIIRRFPDAPGATLATLYFTNSLGGAAGVLLSGFVLIDRFGLPGTIITAGAINLLLACTVWVLARPRPPASALQAPAGRTATVPEQVPLPSRVFMTLMVAAAFLTGLSSLVYEVGWIRMLSLVLGSSTHAFELMLSAFICGLAFGGLWIRKRIDRLPSPVFALAVIQVLMGLLALATLPLYGFSFDAMAGLMGSLGKTDQGYLLFNLGSHAIAFAIMLPATFCAGMTLPVATFALLARGAGERSVGVIYSANTLGAIAGVVAAVHFGLPVLGLKDTIIAGAGIDLALGAVLILFTRSHRKLSRFAISAAIAVVATATASLTVRFDALKLTSGVFRSGTLHIENRTVIAQRDGKTASIALVEASGGILSISTNGKMDAAANLTSILRPTTDEPTMILLGAIGLLLRPEARVVANIGFGSGITTDVALAFPQVEHVDTIEIEPQVVELARGFHPRNARAYADPRSHIHIDDAKSFFSTQRQRYDLIISEPSNPWVSGVAGLFSQEFYRIAGRRLNEGGLLVQWLQLYEIDFELVATILKAIDASFEDYVILATNNIDVVVVASPRGPVPLLGTALPDLPAVLPELARAGVRSVADIGLRVVATRRLIHPLLAGTQVPVNSDYRPIVDQRAVKSRFFASKADALLRVARSPVPVLPMLGGIDAGRDINGASAYRHFETSELKAAAQRFAASPGEYLEPRLEPPKSRDVASHELTAAADACSRVASPEAALAAIVEIAYGVLAFVPPEEVNRTVAWIATQPCGRQQRSDLAMYLRLMAAISTRDAKAMADLSEAILAEPAPDSDRAFWLAAGSGIVGYLALGRLDGAHRLALRHEARLARLAKTDLAVRLALAHVGLPVIGY